MCGIWKPCVLFKTLGYNDVLVIWKPCGLIQTLGYNDVIVIWKPCVVAQTGSDIQLFS